METLKNTSHRLTIHSLHDGMAECSCGYWGFMRTGPITQEEIERKFQQHCQLVGRTRKAKARKMDAIEKLRDLHDELVKATNGAHIGFEHNQDDVLDSWAAQATVILNILMA